MKYVILAIALAAILPLADWLRRNPASHLKVWTVLGSLPFMLTVIPHGFMAVISWAEWQGFSKGAEVSLLDILALSMYLAMPRVRHPLPFKAAFIFYFLAVALSSLFSYNGVQPVAFYLWQLGRMCLLYVVVMRGCAIDERVPHAIIKGMVIGVCIQALYVVQQKLGQGVVQAAGTFGHQNSLGVATYFVVLPAFALLLAGKRGWPLYAVMVAGLLIAVATASRATIGLLAFGLGTIFLLSAMRQWTGRKARYAMIGAAAMIVLVPVALASLETRFGDSSIFESVDDREAFKEAASMMLADHPMGIGANTFTFLANVGGYYERAGVSWASRAAIVHNAYWLAACETGYLGLIAFVIFLAQPLIVAFRCGWRNRRDLRGDLLLGIGVALLTLYIHSLFEWILFTFVTQYILAISIGMVAGIAIQLGYWRGRARTAPVAVNQLAGQIK